MRRFVVTLGALVAATAVLVGPSARSGAGATRPSVPQGFHAGPPDAPGRYAVDALPTEDPLRLARELAGAGGRLVSIVQVHDTLEDLFVRQVDQASGTDRFAVPPAAVAGGAR